MFLLLAGRLAAGAGAYNQTSPPTKGAILDVKSFGARGDGVSDDTQPIARAGQALVKLGGTLKFPAGTYIFDPGKAKILIGPRSTLLGPGTIKVKAGAGNYDYLIGASRPQDPLDQVVLDGLTVDQNPQENESAVIAGGGDLKSSQFVFLSWNVRSLVVRDCTFRASGVNTVVANGANVESAAFSNNTVIFQKRAPQPPFDNSAFYFSGKKATFTGNHCVGTPRSAAVTCIEVHDGDVDIQNNTISNYLIGMNIVDVTSAKISKNLGTDLENGVFIWATPRQFSRNVTVINNSFSIDNVTRDAPQSAGIATYYGRDVTGTWDGLLIAGNRILFQPELRPRYIHYPRSNWGISTQAFGPVRNVTITENSIENAPVRGIKIGQMVESPPSRPLQSEIRVERNTIVNAGYDSDASVAPYRAAIAAEGQLRDVLIRENTIAESAVSPGVFSVWFLSGTGPYERVKCGTQKMRSGLPLRQAIPPEIEH